MIRHGGRAVTAADYQELALRTPGVAMGRVEVLERFKPQQRRFRQSRRRLGHGDARADRHRAARPAARPRDAGDASMPGWTQRRPLSTELYVIGTDYVPIGSAPRSS